MWTKLVPVQQCLFTTYLSAVNETEPQLHVCRYSSTVSREATLLSAAAAGETSHRLDDATKMSSWNGSICAVMRDSLSQNGSQVRLAEFGQYIQAARHVAALVLTFHLLYTHQV